MKNNLQIDNSMIESTTAQVVDMLNVFEFYQNLQVRPEAKKNKHDLEDVVESAQRAYTVTSAIMKTFIEENDLTGSERSEKRALNLYALHIGCTEGLEQIADDDTEVRKSRISLDNFRFGVGKPENYKTSLNSLAKYQAELIRKVTTPAKAFQAEFLSALRDSIEREFKKPEYREILKELKETRVTIQGKTYRGFKEEKENRQTSSGADRGDMLDLEILESHTTEVEQTQLTKPAHHYLRGKPSEDAVNQLQDYLETRAFFKEMIKYVHPRQLPRFIIMEGPPGTGKTTMVKSLALESGLSYVVAQASDIGSSLQHETAKNLDRLYKHAKAKREKEGTESCVILIDEGEVIAKRPVTGNNQDGNELGSALKSKIEGIATDYQIVLVITTNHYDLIDPNIAHRGKRIKVGYPETVEDLQAVQQGVIERATDYTQIANPGLQVFQPWSKEYNRLLPFSEDNPAYLAGRIIDDLFGAALVEEVKASFKEGRSIVPVSVDKLVKTYQTHDLPDDYKNMKMPALRGTNGAGLHA